MKFHHLALFGCCLLIPACKREAGSSSNAALPVPPKDSAVDLVDTHVSVALNRSVLGLSLEKPISREAGTINGVETSITGYVRQVTEQYLVLSRHPRPDDHDKEGSLLWIPHSSILTVRQSYPGAKAERGEHGQPSSWRLEALEGLMNLIGFDLRELPQGELQVWVERGGRKEFMDSFDTYPGHEQWLYLGIEPFKREAFMMTVLSDEDRGASQVFLPVDQPKNLFKEKIGPKHDWTKPTLLATESPGAGNARIYAQLTRKSQ